MLKISTRQVVKLKMKCIAMPYQIVFSLIRKFPRRIAKGISQKKDNILK